MDLDTPEMPCSDSSMAQADSDVLVKWYCTERLVKSFCNLPKSVSEQVARNLALIVSQFLARGIRISDIDFVSRSCGYTVDGEFYVVEW